MNTERPELIEEMRDEMARMRLELMSLRAGRDRLAAALERIAALPVPRAVEAIAIADAAVSPQPPTTE